MRRFGWLTATATVAVLGLLVLAVAHPGDSGRARAATSGIGGTISVGAVAGTTVPVNTTAPTDPFKGFNIHVLGLASAGLSGVGIAPNATGSLVTTSPFCATSTIAPAEVVYGCTAVPT